MYAKQIGHTVRMSAEVCPEASPKIWRFTGWTKYFFVSYMFWHLMDNIHITYTPDVEKFQMSIHLSCGEIWNYSTCGEISDFSTSVVHRNLKFLHMTDFSPHIPFVRNVTNIRYASFQSTSTILSISCFFYTWVGIVFLIFVLPHPLWRKCNTLKLPHIYISILHIYLIRTYL